jgi:hypothetical protein
LTVSPQEVTPPQPQDFSSGSYLLGFVMAMVVGIFFDFLAWELAPRGKNIGAGVAFGLSFGVLPGVVLLAMAFGSRRTSFGLGVITGACLVLLLGGACGAFLGTWQGGLYGHSR